MERVNALESLMGTLEDAGLDNIFLSILQAENETQQALPDISMIEVVEEECPECTGGGTARQSECTYCHGTGEIVRPAEWGEIEIKIARTGEVVLLDTPYLDIKSGGRLRIKK